MECIPEQTLLRFNVRETKRDKIVRFFSENLGKTYGTMFLHDLFGTAFRSRVSEINRWSYPIAIKNKTEIVNGKETSVYWSEKK